MRVGRLFVLFACLLGVGLLTACGDADPVAAASCDCDAGRDGTTVWCEHHKVGWVAGKRAPDKQAVDTALAAEVRANAEAKGQSGDWIDAIVTDVALGTVKKKACACEQCQDGEACEEETPAKPDPNTDGAAKDDGAGS